MQDFTLTFLAKTRSWCQSLLVASIHNWDQFVTMFLCKFDGYNYEQVCDDFEELQRFKNESLIDFTIRFRLNYLKFKIEEKPMDQELLDYYERIFSLPPIHNPCEIISSFTQSYSNLINIIENSNMEVQKNDDEVASIMYDQLLHLVHTSYSIYSD